MTHDEMAAQLRVAGWRVQEPEMTKAKLLAHYENRDPKRFFQMDCWNNGIDRTDRAGPAFSSGITTELLHSATVHIKEGVMEQTVAQHDDLIPF